MRRRGEEGRVLNASLPAWLAAQMRGRKERRGKEGRHKMGSDQERICLILKAEKEEVEHSKHNALFCSAQLNSHYGNFIDPILRPAA